MPWWGWLIAAVIALGAAYLVIWAVFARTVFKQVKSVHQEASRHLGESGFFKNDPFDDPFFKDPFGKGQVRKPKSKYL